MITPTFKIGKPPISIDHFAVFATYVTLKFLYHPGIQFFFLHNKINSVQWKLNKYTYMWLLNDAWNIKCIFKMLTATNIDMKVEKDKTRMCNLFGSNLYFFSSILWFFQGLYITEQNSYSPKIIIFLIMLLNSPHWRLRNCHLNKFACSIKPANKTASSIYTPVSRNFTLLYSGLFE